MDQSVGNLTFTTLTTFFWSSLWPASQKVLLSVIILATLPALKMLAQSLYGVFPDLLCQCISVTYARRMARRHDHVIRNA